MVIVQQIALPMKSALVWTLADVTLFDGRNTTAPGRFLPNEANRGNQL
jgi:uncharacterized lipoprotein YbaY